MIQIKSVKGGHWTGSLMSVGIATLATLVFGFLALTLMSDKPLATLLQMLSFPFQGGTPAVQWGKVLSEGMYLSVVALGLSIGYRANIWNIGAEGQFAVGAIGAFATWLIFGQPTSGLALPLILIGGCLGGMAWAAIPATLKAHLNTNELLVSLMLVYVASNLLTYLVQGPWQGCAPVFQDGVQAGCIPYSPAQSDKVAGALQFEPLIYGVSKSSGALIGTKIHEGLLVLLAGFILVALVLFGTVLGYRLRVAQSSAKAERFAGFSPAVTIWISFLMSGGLAGFVGAVYLLADSQSLTVGPTFLNGLGFAAIVIAFLGRLNPVGILLAGFVIAYINAGASWVASDSNLRADDSVAGIIEAIALFCALATTALVNWKISLRSTSNRSAGHG